MIATIIIVVIVAVLAVIGVKRMAGMAKGNSCCSSGDGGELKPRKKKLEGEVIAKRELDIEGMSCINCQYKVERKINDIKGVRAHVDFKKNKARVEMDREVPDDIINSAVESIGYKVTAIRSIG